MFTETKKDGEAQTENRWRMSLLRAAALLEQNGWCQGRTHDSKGRHCLYGAIWRAHYGDDPTTGPVPKSRWEWTEVFELMRKQVGGDAAEWNDAPERNKEEVIAALRAAAAA